MVNYSMADALSSHVMCLQQFTLSSPYLNLPQLLPTPGEDQGYIVSRCSLPYWPTRLCCHNAFDFVWNTAKGSYDNHQCMWLKICSPAWFVWLEEFPWRRDRLFPHQKVSLLAKISKVNFLSREGQRNHSRILTCLSTQGMGLEADEEAEHSSCCWGRSWRWGGGDTSHLLPSRSTHSRYLFLNQFLYL